MPPLFVPAETLNVIFTAVVDGEITYEVVGEKAPTSLEIFEQEVSSVKLLPARIALIVPRLMLADAEEVQLPEPKFVNDSVNSVLLVAVLEAVELDVDLQVLLAVVIEPFNPNVFAITI